MQRAALGQAGQTGGDRSKLIGPGPVQALGDRHRQPVGGDDHGVGDPRGALSEVAEEPVEVAGFGAELRHGRSWRGDVCWPGSSCSGSVVGRLAGSRPLTIRPGCGRALVAGQHATDLVGKHSGWSANRASWAEALPRARHMAGRGGRRMAASMGWRPAKAIGLRRSVAVLLTATERGAEGYWNHTKGAG
jgi:hypothetical protein